jgi:hypothetical protein
VTLQACEGVGRQGVVETRQAGLIDAEPTVCFPADDGEDASEQAGRCEAGFDGYYSHPLQAVEPVAGGYPFVDVQISANGRAYALQEGGSADEDGAYEDLGSRVVELDIEPLDTSALTKLPEVVAGSYEHQKVGPGTVAWLASATAEEIVWIDVLVSRPPNDTMAVRLHRAIAQGAIATHRERERVRLDLLADLQAENAAALAPLVEELRAAGVEIDRVGVHISSLRVAASPAVVARLAEREDVVRIDKVEPGTVAGANGREKAEALQFRQNWDEQWACGLTPACNYDGENGTDWDIRVAVVDPLEFYEDHVAFREETGTGSRISERWDCNANPCVSVAAGEWSPPEGEHGTLVLAAVLGDLRDGQDVGIVGTTAREEKSAAGGEAKAYLYEGDPSDLTRVMDHVPGRSPAPHLLVSSMGSPGVAPDWKDCNGDTAREGEVDQFFEAGYGLFQAAGNDLVDPGADEDDFDDPGTDGSATNCTVWEPGSAIGAFTVGAYDQIDGEPSQMRAAAAEAQSAWGGSPSNVTEGRLRTVIDLLGPWGSDGLAVDTGTDDYSNSIGTSFANPTVAGVAVAFIDMMKNARGSNMVDDPGMLYAWMLNLGDRGDGTGFNTKRATGFHQRFGAGRTTNRFVGHAGMDAPWYWYQWETCVAHGASVVLPINGGVALPASVDSIRATAWWYDRRFNGGTALDNLGLRVRKTDGTPIASSNTFDNKERVYNGTVGNKAIELVVEGWSVTSDVEGCGTNSMRVWVVALVEDDARNDGDGPTWDPLDREGVQPL